MNQPAPNGRLLSGLLLSFIAVFIWSGVYPRERFTWFLEVWPALIGVAVLLFTRRSFPLTSLLYILLWLHVTILLVGGHYTYADVPLFNWLRDHFGQARNNYDKVGHFAQGFVPAMVAREVLLRKRIVAGRGWLFFIVVCICGAISATYELLEWGVAASTGGAADAFLGTQGDPWDTQKDMLFAFTGAMTALLSLGRIHDRALNIGSSSSD
jgi:putative membrane protein